MNNLFVIRNQHGLYISKKKEWLDGREPRLLFRSQHRDEAVNLVFELSSRDISLRAEVVRVELASNKHPVVEVTAEPTAGTEPGHSQQASMEETKADHQDQDQTELLTD